MDYILWVVPYRASSTIARQLQSPDISHVCSFYSFLHKFTHVKSEKHEHQVLLCNERKIIKRQEKTCYMARGGILFHYCILVMIGGLVGNLYRVIFRYFFFFLSIRSFFLSSQLPFQVIAFLAASPGQSPTCHPSPPPPTAWSMASVLILG